MQSNTVWYERPWMNANDRVSYERSLLSDSREQRMIANALLNADPAVSDKDLRRPGQRVVTPSRYGYIETEINIGDVLTGVRDRATAPTTNDFSGSVAGYSGSTHNSWQG